MAKLAPLCRYCGKPIRKLTTSHWFSVREPGRDASTSARTITVDKLPATKEEAQRHLNEEIVSVRRNPDWMSAAFAGLIHQVTTWNGESYANQIFCSGGHAELFGYMMAREYPTKGTMDWALAIDRRNKEKTDAKA